LLLILRGKFDSKLSTLAVSTYKDSVISGDRAISIQFSGNKRFFTAPSRESVGASPQLPKAKISSNLDAHRDLPGMTALKQVIASLLFVSTGHLSSQPVYASVR